LRNLEIDLQFAEKLKIGSGKHEIPSKKQTRRRNTPHARFARDAEPTERSGEHGNRQMAQGKARCRSDLLVAIKFKDSSERLEATIKSSENKRLNP
jgi:hypothetical protein